MSIAAFVLAVVLAACDQQADGGPGALNELPAGEAGTGSTRTMAEQVYLDTLDVNAGTRDIQDDTAVKLGYDICNARNAGMTQYDAMNMLATNGFDNYEAGYLYGAATGALC